MNQLISHIEFLLHDHNCVIIPDFGGFVVNTIPPQRDGIAAFHAPVCELVFNRDLTHNDGLLAQSYMKNDSMTFESAMQKVEQDVQMLKRRLREQYRVDMGKLGSFDMHDDKRFVYTPGAFVRPALFGLTQATLKPLIQMQPAVPVRKSENRQKWVRNTAITAASVAAVALLMFILPVSDTTIVRQSARMLSETGWLQPKASQPLNRIAMTDELVVNETEKAEEYSTTSNGMNIPAMDAVEQNVPDDLPRYYIVMGVYKGVESAQKTTELLLDEGFHQTGWLERPDRIDVYAASFTDEAAAKVYLKEVHKKFPGHNDAWILKR
ncbi:hypothetical protein [Proteiniphilum acetatigenes]|uniref:HU domain-containing protein n=1 Tax=Proteiniphilum acetatigenes TaxID=294710 RepID=UPI00035EB489|nr:hypothetical protein [Proteiniphilum acetatigenes]SFL56311.1 hypothetical protein SAMN05216357_12910 [Porphyromonadaceae bacterium KH3CP3RA]